MVLQFSRHSRFKRFGTLVRTGSILKAASDAGKLLDSVFRLHSFYKGAYSVEIAVAAADEFDVFDNVVIRQIANYLLGTGSLGFVFKAH